MRDLFNCELRSEFNDDLELGGAIDLGMSPEEVAGTQATEFKDVVDGIYDVEIMDTKRKNTNAGHPQLAFTLAVVSDEEEHPFLDKKMFKNIMLPHPGLSDEDKRKRLGFLKGDLKKLGIEDIKPGEDVNAWIWRICNEAKGIVVKVKRYTKPGAQFPNVNFLERKGQTLDEQEDDFYEVLGRAPF
jgi:hypothetical protein